MSSGQLNEKLMYKPIKILPPQLANQIAAGEVVERPASVVKELLENSLDAGASEILIDIEQGGQKRILMRDNGRGIVKEELALALSRHATSKISNIDDLEHITSMGFRGEALASISSVSRLTLTSKPHTQSEAWQAIAEGQQMQVEIKPAAHPDGTSIEVLDLFFNTPARRKFLRTGKTEFQHIEQIVKRIALTRPDVQFVLNHNQKVCCRYLPVKTIAKRIEQVCGKNMLLNGTPVDYGFEGITLTGWCSKLGHGVATRDFQFTFVNGRMMKDKLLAHALRQVYEDTLPPQTFASYVLYLQVSPEQIDVNVHPSKHEVRFHQSRQVHDIVFKAVNDAISRQSDSAGGVDEVALRTPKHNYIQGLGASANGTSDTPISGSSAYLTSADRQPTKTSSRMGGYKPDTPTRAEIKANNSFYASTRDQQRDLQDDDSSNEAAQGESQTTRNKQTLRLPSDSLRPVLPPAVAISHYLYSPPYLVFGQDDHLLVLPIEALLTCLVSNRITHSTLAQPLLMPISIENKSSITQQQLALFADVHMVMSLSHKKLILKQVPSELRHLPWASIFTKLTLSEVNVNSDTLAEMIASVWVNTVEISNTIIDGWMNELGAEKMSLLCVQHASSLHLSNWMSQIK
jgi:DNA mismatch repair protein MutL